MDLLESLKAEEFDLTGWYTVKQIMESADWSETKAYSVCQRKVRAGEWETRNAVVNGHMCTVYRLK